MTTADLTPLFGYAFSRLPTAEAVAADILEWIARPPAGMRQTVTTPNAFLVVAGNQKRHKALKKFLAGSRWTLADGMPVVLTARLKSQHLPRVTGSDLFPVLWKKVKEKSLPVSMVVTSENLAQRIGANYAQAHTQVPLFFDENDEDYIQAFAQKVAREVVSKSVSLIFLGIRFPKQDKLGRAIQEALTQAGYAGNTVILLLGASYEFHFGLKKRAPLAWQRAGMEWLYRFGQEPRRLFKRYTVDNFRFALLMLRELLKSKKGN